MKHIKLYFYTLAFTGLAINSYAQINIGGEPYSWKNGISNKQEIPIVRFPALDLQRLAEEDKWDEQNGMPPRFGYKHQTDLSTANSGVWTELPNGDKLWQLEVSCSSALSINFLYSKFWLPKGGILYIYNKNKQSLIGGFTSANNKGNLEHIRGFGTGLVYGDDVILEYYEPHFVSQTAVIYISEVVHGYRHIQLPNTANKTDNFGDAGNCQVNINCQEGADWQDEKRGVALIVVNGNRYCTGSLVNNVNRDGDLLFLTAHHCLGGWANDPNKDAENNSDADDWSFVWNYESPNCANPQNEPQQFTTNGAIVLANDAPSDFALLRLTESPLALQMAQPVYFNGWDRTNNPPAGGVGIHHPKGDIKKIATYNITPIGNTNCSPNPANFWEINWQQTANGFSVMQPGSSGSPLFTVNSKIIGQLYGPMNCGLQQCDAPANQEVVYGRLSVSWNNGQQATRRLRDWLDPGNTNAQQLDGGYWDNCQAVVTVAVPINNFADIQATNQITANSTLANGANVHMQAGTFIEFTNGFDAQIGSTLIAEIAPCQNRVIPPANKTDEWSNSEVVSANSKQQNLPIKIFPNPSHGKFNIDFYPSNETIYFSVVDMVGQNVLDFKKTYVAGQTIETLDLSNQAEGIYIVTIKGMYYNIAQKIILQNN